MMLFKCHHDPVKWKLSWVYQMCFYMSSCCFVSKIYIWHFGMVNLTWWRNINMRLYDLLFSNYQMHQSVLQVACSFSEAITIDTTDNSKLNTSKCVVPWLPEYCDYEAGSTLFQLSLDGHMSFAIFPLLSIGVHWTKMQVMVRLYPMLIAEFMFRLQGHLLLAAYFMVTKIQNVKYLQAPSTLLWLSYNGRIPRLVHLLANAVLDQREMLQCLAFLVQQQQLSDVPLTGIIVNQQLWDPGGDPYFLDGYNSRDYLTDQDRSYSVSMLVYLWLHWHDVIPLKLGNTMGLYSNTAFSNEAQTQGVSVWIVSRDASQIKPDNKMIQCQLLNIVELWHFASFFDSTFRDESAEALQLVGNVIFKLDFYSLVIEDP